MEGHNSWGNCSEAERHYKEVRHKLVLEKGVICNGDMVVPSETRKKILMKSVHGDINCVIAATQKWLKLEEIFKRCERICKKMSEMWKNKKFYTKEVTFIA